MRKLLCACVLLLSLNSLLAQGFSLPLHVEGQIGLSVPTGEALRGPYLLGPEGMVGLSWLSAEQTWLVRGEGSYAFLANRPAEDQLSQHHLWGASLRGGPGVALGEAWQLHLLLGAGYAWASDNLQLPDDELINYLKAEGFTGHVALNLTGYQRWTLELDFRWFNPEIALSEDIDQLLIQRGSQYALFSIPSQRFAMHRLGLRIGVRL